MAKDLTREEKLLIHEGSPPNDGHDAIKKGEHSKALDEARDLMKDARAVFEALIRPRTLANSSVMPHP